MYSPFGCRENENTSYGQLVELVARDAWPQHSAAYRPFRETRSIVTLQEEAYYCTFLLSSSYRFLDCEAMAEPEGKELHGR